MQLVQKFKSGEAFKFGVPASGQSFREESILQNREKNPTSWHTDVLLKGPADLRIGPWNMIIPKTHDCEISVSPPGYFKIRNLGVDQNMCRKMWIYAPSREVPVELTLRSINRLENQEDPV